MWAVQSEKSAGAIVSLWMDPSGRIYECETLKRIGDERLANEICGLVLRKRVRPAMDRNGEVISGNVVTLIKLTIPGTPIGDKIGPMVQSPDLTLELNRLPDELVSPYKLSLAVEVDTDGGIVACNGDEKSDKTLANLACGRLAGETFDKAADKKGNPIGYVRALKVTFALTGKL